jgi:hypothetical protein
MNRTAGSHVFATRGKGSEVGMAGCRSWLSIFAINTSVSHRVLKGGAIARVTPAYGSRGRGALTNVGQEIDHGADITT